MILAIFSDMQIDQADDKFGTLYDNIEKSLWDIKEIYDLETEEVEKVVLQKREFSFLRNEKIQRILIG